MKHEIYLYGFNKNQDLSWTEDLEQTCKIVITSKLDIAKVGIELNKSSIVIAKLKSFSEYRKILDLGITPEKILIYGEFNNEKELKQIFETKPLDWVESFRSAHEACMKLALLFKKLGRSKSILIMPPIDNVYDNLNLTRKEELMLAFIAQKKSPTKDQLFKHIWKNNSVTAKTVDVHLFNLRKKLKKVDMNIVLTKEGRLEVA